MGLVVWCTSKRLEDCQERVGWSIATRNAVDGSDPGERPLLQREVGMHLRRLDTLVPEPESDDRHVDTRVQEPHRGCGRTWGVRRLVTREGHAVTAVGA